MVGRLIQVEWKTSLLKAGWVFPPEIGKDETLLPRLKLWWVPRRLLDAALTHRFKKLISGTRFRNLWGEVCGGLDNPSDKTFLLKFAGGAWDVPWELLIAELASSHNRKTVSLVRSSGDSTPVAPSVFVEPLRTLMLKGAPDGPGLDRLDLDAEVQIIQEAWDSLERNVQESISRPEVAEARQEDLSEILAKTRPDIIWFTGHGEAEPARLWFADRSWVDASSFARFIKNSTHRPLYVVLSACDTARAETGNGPGSYSPRLFQELAQIGALSVLAMQSPFGAASAAFLTQGLFRYLAIGLPLEKALARVRAEMLDHPPHDSQPLDWASPVVWSAGVPIEELHWNERKQKLAQYQVLGRYVLDWGQETFPRQENFLHINSPISDAEKTRASEWAQRTRTWIQHTIDEGERRVYWLRTLQAIHAQTERFVITLELDAGDPLKSLPSWAQNVYRQMLPMDFPGEIARIVEKIGRIPIEGWNELCHFAGIYIAIANPPAYHDATASWFWNPLLAESNELRVAVMSDQEVRGNLNEKWQIDRMADRAEDNLIEAAISSAPRLARAMACLNMPLRSSHLFVNAEAGEGIGSLWDWDEAKDVTVETAAGPVMTAIARKSILERTASGLESITAHRDCANILGNPAIQRTTAIREHLVEHLVKAEMVDDAIIEAMNLCLIYRSEDNPSSVIKLVEHLGKKDRKRLLAHAHLIVAWSYLQLGQVERAQFWLNNTNATAPEDIAWRHGLLAEVYKSKVVEDSKNKALEEILQAIQVCEAAEAKHPQGWLFRRRTLAYRQDLARIKQFLFYRLEEAAGEYEQLVNQWSDQPDSGLDLATVKRNYAECLLSIAKVRGEVRDKAIEQLQDAEQLAGDYPHAPVLAEILYEKAKIAEASAAAGVPWGDPDKFLLDCLDAAQTSRHYMLMAIAQSRLFWRNEGGSLNRWREIEAELESFSEHGWAFRTMIQGRLRAARRLERDGDLTGSLTTLESSRASLENKPAYNEGRSDRFRIAATMAGLDVVGRKQGTVISAWSDFQNHYGWAQDWLHEQPQQTAEEIWQEVK
jgi:hypothetical protein